MFLGQYRHNLDSKDRLTIPAKYRTQLGDGFTIVQGYDRNLAAYPDESFEQVARKVRGLNPTDLTARMLSRMVFSTANRVDIDRGGRVLIPEFLRKFAGLANEVVLVGMGDFFEIWSSEEWAKQEAALMDAEANADRFRLLNLASE
jgi:MraZ protein